MKNVTPKEGQVWENDGNKWVVMAAMLKGPRVKVWRTDTNDELTFSVGFTDVFKFVPQSDLEWLAVNEPDWFHSDCHWVRRDSNDRPMYTDQPHHESNQQYIYYTREQWQNMRYELGLDDKHKVYEESSRKHMQKLAAKIMDEIIYATPITQKETKMIDLSEAKAGDKFVDDNDSIIELKFKSSTKQPMFICEEVYGYFVGIYNNLGCNENQSRASIVSKHDSRTDEEKAIEDIQRHNTFTTVDFVDAIKADKINGVKWVGE